MENASVHTPNYSLFSFLLQLNLKKKTKKKNNRHAEDSICTAAALLQLPDRTAVSQMCL